MANAAAGEPLGYRNAVVLYSGQTTQGTPVTPATNCGLALVSYTRHSGNKRYRGPGSPNVVAVKGGDAYTDWNIRMAAVVTGAKSLLQKAARANGVVPWLTLGFGYVDDTPTTPVKDADEIQDAKVSTLRLGLDASSGHGPLTAEIAGIGGLVSDITSLTAGTIATKPWESYEGVFTRDGSGFELRTFDMKVDHHLRRDHVIYGAAPGSFQRGFRYLTEQAQEITGTVSRYARAGVNVQANTLSEKDMVLTLTSVDDAATLTVTLTSCDFGEESVSEDEGGIFYTYPWTAKSWTIA